MRHKPPALLLSTLLATTGVCLSSFAAAELDTDSANAILSASGCAVCHATAEKKLGPSWDDIAAKYDDPENAKALLSDRVRNGSSGVWGQIPMMAVPETTISDADLNAVLEWILAR